MISTHMPLQFLRQFHGRAWSDWPLLAVVGHFGFWLLVNASIYWVIAIFGLDAPRPIAVTMAILATAQMIAVYLRRVLVLRELWLVSLICTMISTTYLALADPWATHSWRGLVGFATLFLIHFSLFSPWYLRLLLKGLGREPSPAHEGAGLRTWIAGLSRESLRRFHDRVWTRQPVLAVVGMYAFMLLILGCVVGCVIPFLFSSHTPKDDLRLSVWLLLMLMLFPQYVGTRLSVLPGRAQRGLMAVACTALCLLFIVWRHGFSLPSWPHGMLALALLFGAHALMFSAWMLRLWIR